MVYVVLFHQLTNFWVIELRNEYTETIGIFLILRIEGLSRHSLKLSVNFSRGFEFILVGLEVRVLTCVIFVA